MTSTLISTPEPHTLPPRAMILPRDHRSRPAESAGVSIDVQGFNLWYGERSTLHDLTLAIPCRAITAIIGPSGRGKSTFLRSINRMNDLIGNVRVAGELTVEGTGVYSSGIDLVSRNLERVADLATNIAEDVVFLVEGKSIKHHSEDRGDPTT